MPRRPVTASPLLQTLTHQPTWSTGAFISRRSESSWRFGWAAGLPIVTSPVTVSFGGSRRSRSIAMIEPRLWPTMTISPSSGSSSRTMRSVRARMPGLVT